MRVSAVHTVLNRISFRSNFMRPDHSRNVIGFTPATCHIRSKSDADTLRTETHRQISKQVFLQRGRNAYPLRRATSRCVLGIRPQQLPKPTSAPPFPNQTRMTTHLAHQSFLPRLFTVPLDVLDIVQRYSVLTEETAVYYKVSFFSSRAENGGWLPSDFRFDGDCEAVRRVAMGTAPVKKI